MAGELTRVLTTSAIDRQHGRALDQIRRRADLGLAIVNEVAALEQTAIMRLAETALIKQQAVSMFPQDQPTFDLMLVGAAMNMRQVINRVGRSL